MTTALQLNLFRYSYHKDGAKPTGNQVFVFGSNTAGRHGKGAALVAKRKYGAKYGVGQGHTGNAYAVPTKDASLRVLPLKTIRRNVKLFRQYAKENPELTFLVTRLGCGLAGYEDSEIAVMFRGATRRCSFPLEWKPFLE